MSFGPASSDVHKAVYEYKRLGSGRDSGGVLKRSFIIFFVHFFFLLVSWEPLRGGQRARHGGWPTASLLAHSATHYCPISYPLRHHAFHH